MLLLLLFTGVRSRRTVCCAETGGRFRRNDEYGIDRGRDPLRDRQRVARPASPVRSLGL